MTATGPDVLRCSDLPPGSLDAVLGPYGLRCESVTAGEPIPGSYWGDEEAGLVGDRLLLRPDTPAHSALHEACHWICMDAGGGYDEENAVCYLQILLASEVPGFGRERMLTDMDAWGYSFRLGSARAWFENDAEDALAWLRRHDIVDDEGRPTGRRRP